MMDEKELKVWDTFDRTQIEQIIQGNIRSVDEKMGQMLDLFITSGYYLRRQYAEQQYKDAGYDRFDDYVKDVYGKSRAWATRMMQINEQYSIGGNDPRLDPQYRGYGISQLQEMLYLTDEQKEQVSPDMTVREIRALREPEEKAITATIDLSGDDRDGRSDDDSQTAPDQDTDESVPGQIEADNKQDRDIPVKPILRKPGEEEKEILNSLARKLIESMRDWFSEDFHDRVLDVISGEKALKNRVASNGQRTRNFNHDLILYYANLFDDYVQLWNAQECECIGNFEWFYLSAAIQSMWNVVELERAQKDFATSQKSLAEQYHDGEISKEELWNGRATGSAPEKNELREAGLSERTISTLSQAGITTLCELEEAFDNDELTSIRGMSNKQMNEIKTAISRNNEADQKDAEELDSEQEEDLDEPVVDADYTEMPKEITPKSILDEAKRNLYMYIEYEAPGEMIEKQKTIVAALAGMASDLEEAEEAEEPKQPELPKFKNNDQRKAWLEDYKAWGMWYRDDRIDVNYYKYDFPDGSRLIAAEYPGRKNPWIVGGRDEVFYHLLDKREKPICSDKYCHSPISMTYLVELLKEVQR